MRNKIFSILYLVFAILFLVYLCFPGPLFPTALWDFKVSTQPADQESLLRRGYYTNLTREQLMSHYAGEFEWGIRLNYPPEEAKTLIRDQTKSSFLEEIVHPMRESLFINGYKPSAYEEVLVVDGVRYESKVIVKYVNSNIFLRLSVGLGILGVLWILVREWRKAINSLKWISR